MMPPTKCTLKKLGNGAKGIPHIPAPSVSALVRLSNFSSGYFRGPYSSQDSPCNEVIPDCKGTIPDKYMVLACGCGFNLMVDST